MITGAWAKSSHSNPAGACVEARWAKSSHSWQQNCAEVRAAAGTVQVRDSKDPDGPVLSFTPSGWEAFLAGIRGGELGR